jgi:phosphoglycerol transferase MdoB-like AlkP superfamily enzyme
VFRIRIPPRLFPAAALAAVLVLLATATRIALALRPDTVVPDLAALAQAFGRGLWFDLAAAIFALTPFVLWLALAPDRLARTWVYRSVSLVLFGTACFSLLVLAVAEWLFWEEFAARFNFIAVDYLLYTQEVIGNIWQSYPVGRILVMLALAAAVATTLLARRLWAASGAPLGWRAMGATLVVQVMLFGGALQLADEDQKQFSTLDPVNELAGNGLYDFFAAERRNELSFERYYATVAPAEALATVRAGFPRARWVEPERGGMERTVAGIGAEKHLNVVLVSVESLGAEYLGAYGDPRGLTPNLDRLAAQSLWFAKVYATGNRTVRGMEALSLALPPTPGESIVRRPNNGRLFSLGSVFEDKGYSVLFAYGGYGYFDNMNAYFDANDYRVIDRSNIPDDKIAFENIWGVADEHLFDQVLREIDAEKAARPKRPVFVHVMTTSNHRPYTYPPGRIDIPPPGGREGGVKYTDYALGRFLEQARARPWFRDTLFVITADHGANARGGLRIPVDKYLIPVFVYAPAQLAPMRVDRLMSQIDIAPTLLGLMKFRYYSKFFGRDVLHAPRETDRAFVANYETLGYLKRDRLLVLHPKRRVEEFIMHGPTLERVGEPDSGLTREAIAYYQLASELYRGGLYVDEEQIPPGPRRIAAIVAQRRKEGAN